MPTSARHAEKYLMSTMTEEGMSTPELETESTVTTETVEKSDQLQSEFKRLVLDGKLDPKVTDALSALEDEEEAERLLEAALDVLAERA